MSITAAPRRRLALLLVAVLAAALGGFATQTATAAPAGPAAIRIDRVYSDVAVPTGLPTGAAPYMVVKTGGTFSVAVTFLDARGRSTSFDAPTTLSMTASSNMGPVVVVHNPVLVAKGQRTALISGTIGVAANQVRLTMSAGGIITAAGSDQLFDVLATVKSEPAAAQQGIGGSDGSCSSATPTAQVCGTLLLPNGAASEKVFMSLGACDGTDYTKCGNRLGGSIVQVLADLTAPNPNPKRAEIDLYTKTSPATLILTCDTTLCETGAIQGIPVNYSLSGNGDLVPAPACPRKGTVGASQEVCVDYVQSKRDGASDTILYLLFTRDLRGGIG
jgi:hypothetical protein